MKKFNINNRSNRNCSEDYRYGIIKTWLEKNVDHDPTQSCGMIYDAITGVEQVPSQFRSVDENIACLSLLQEAMEYSYDRGITGLIVTPSDELKNWIVSGQTSPMPENWAWDAKEGKYLTDAVKWFEENGCNFLVGIEREGGYEIFDPYTNTEEFIYYEEIGTYGYSHGRRAA